LDAGEGNALSLRPEDDLIARIRRQGLGQVAVLAGKILVREKELHGEASRVSPYDNTICPVGSIAPQEDDAARISKRQFHRFLLSY
jgi:hypothetical protein